MVPLLISFCLLAAPFPLPAVDGKPLALTEGQKTFRLPMRFEKVKAFYQERFTAETGHTLRLAGAAGARTLTLTSKVSADSWKKAVVKERELETVIELTPVLRMAGEQVDGRGKPLVEFIIGRSGDVDAALESIDHLER